jgi:hypothetical protein
MLPLILAILAPEYKIKDIAPLHVTHLCSHGGLKASDSFDYLSEYLEAEFVLLRYAVRVIGLLFKSRSGDAEKREHFIGLLMHLAVSKPRVLSGWNRLNDLHSLEERLMLEVFRLKLEAIRQLEQCLHAPFRDLPHSHFSVNTLISALCDIVSFYSLKEEVHQIDTHTHSILCLAAIIPLARLSCTRNGQGIFLPREQVSDKIPDVVMSVLCDDRWIEGHDPITDLTHSLPMVLEEEICWTEGGDDIAPFVYIKQGSGQHSKRNEDPTNRKGSSSERTVVDLESVAAELKNTLCAYSPQNEGSHGDTQNDLSPIVRLMCFKTISSFLSHGVSFPNPTEDTTWLLNVKPESLDEAISHSEAVSLLANCLGKLQLSKRLKIDVSEGFINQICQVLVNLSTQTEQPIVVKNACCGLVTLLTSMQRNAKNGCKNKTSLSEMTLSNTLTHLIEFLCQLLEHNKSWPGNILVPLINGKLKSYNCKHVFYLAQLQRIRLRPS